MITKLNRFIFELNDNLKNILLEYRNKIEKDYNTVDFLNFCGEISENLSNYLNENGFESKPTWGYYLNASLDFVPDIDVLVQNDEDFDEDDFWSSYEEAKEEGKSLMYAHWWVKLADGTNVDLTADQFHPDEKESYRIVITKSNEHYQEG